MLTLREHPLEEAFDWSEPSIEEEKPEATPAPDPAEKRHPLRRVDGSPIGLGAYCETVTPAWRWDWPHLKKIDEVLDKVERGELKRVIIEMPPRHGKTEKSTIRNPAYRLELSPQLRIIVGAYNAKLAQRFSRKIRRVVRGRVELSRERNAADDWETIDGGGVRAVGVGEGVAGLPGDLILIDDPIKNRKEAFSEAYRNALWEWYTEDIYTRLEPGGAIVITMTRRHEDDLVGRILASEDASDWVVIRLPALAEVDDELGRPVGAALCPERYDEEALKKIRRAIGELRFSSLYQQRPSPASGLIFKSEWWHYYTTRDHPIVENGVQVPYLPDVFSSHLQSWDMSFKDKKSSDKISGQVWSRLGANIYLRDRVNKRADFVATIKEVRAMTKKWPKALLKLVEDKANGPAVISALRMEIPGLVAVEPDGDKVARAYAVTPIYESHNVWLPHPQIAPWITAWQLEHLQFPFAANDDDVDASTQALKRLIRQIAGEPDPASDPAKLPKSEAAAVASERF